MSNLWKDWAHSIELLSTSRHSTRKVHTISKISCTAITVERRDSSIGEEKSWILGSGATHYLTNDQSKVEDATLFMDLKE